MPHTRGEATGAFALTDVAAFTSRMFGGIAAPRDLPSIAATLMPRSGPTLITLKPVAHQTKHVTKQLAANSEVS